MDIEAADGNITVKVLPYPARLFDERAHLGRGVVQSERIDGFRLLPDANSDRPVTRSLIIEHVWDIHFDSIVGRRLARPKFGDLVSRPTPSANHQVSIVPYSESLIRGRLDCAVAVGLELALGLRVDLWLTEGRVQFLRVAAHRRTRPPHDSW